MNICALCGCEMEANTPEMEDRARAELMHYFGDVPPEECDRVCDDCWERIHPERN